MSAERQRIGLWRHVNLDARFGDRGAACPSSLILLRIRQSVSVGEGGQIQRLRRLLRWSSSHRLITGVAAVVVALAVWVLVAHRAATGSWTPHSRTVVLRATSPWTAQEPISTAHGVFAVSTAGGTHGSTCYRIQPTKPPFPGYSGIGGSQSCVDFGRGLPRYFFPLDTLSSLPGVSYGLVAAAVNRDVQSVDLQVRTSTYDPQISNYRTADLMASPVDGVVVITFPPDEVPLSVTISTSQGKHQPCDALSDSSLPMC